MPNWCNNSITLIHSDDKINEVLKDYLTEDEFGDLSLDFQKISPIPEKLKNTTSPTPKDIDPALQKELINNYGYDNWYDWCVANWGTKWNASDCHIDESGTSFTTAWAPPNPIVAKLAELTSHDFRMTYIEEGVDFCGEFLAYADGKTLDNEYSPIADAPEELKEELGYEPWEDEDNEEQEEEEKD